MFADTARSVVGLVALIAIQLHLASVSVAQQQPFELGGTASLERVISALEKEEAKYRDIEYSLRITTRRFQPQHDEAPGELMLEEAQSVVLQGPLLRFHRTASPLVFKTKLNIEETSAYDGDQTKTVVSGNGVNVHDGKYEHPDVYPAHSIALIHYKLNFPLSVYLRGTEAIHAHPKYPHFARPTGYPISFEKVEAHVEGDDKIGDLRCVRIRCERSYSPGDTPSVQTLWLCPERNYHCIKEQLRRPVFGGEMPLYEMRVETLKEVTPGIWLPERIVVDTFHGEALREKKLKLSERKETLVQNVNLSPNHERDFFQVREVPATLPVFTIKNGTLIGSKLAEPIDDPIEEERKLKEVVSKLREQEGLYANLTAFVRVHYRHLHSDLFMEGIMTEREQEERSVLHGNIGFFGSKGRYYTVGGQQANQNEVQAFDGDWTRQLWETQTDEKPMQRSASIRKGGGGKAEGRHDGLPVYRPHTFLIRDDWQYGLLADFLVSPWHDKINKYRIRFRYCGEEQLDGHPCVKLRDEVTTREGQPPHGYSVYWLALDRNYIPIRSEHYGGNFGLHPFPTGINYCDDFRELAPGVWYPFRTTHFAFNQLDLTQRRIVLNWRRVREVVSAELQASAEKELFANVTVPKATKVSVSDEDSRPLGSFLQENDGPLTVSSTKYMALQSAAKLREEDRKAREDAAKSLIGKRVPEFPKNATWLNGQPLAWKDLYGKVVILDFWAEWCGPCRNDFPQLRLLHDHREANGLTIIGVHPPGSEQGSIKKIVEEFHLDYPTLIDLAPREGVKAWGDYFGLCAVFDIPRAMAVDTDGTIIACGKLSEVAQAAAERVKKER